MDQVVWGFLEDTLLAARLFPGRYAQALGSGLGRSIDEGGLLHCVGRASALFLHIRSKFLGSVTTFTSKEPMYRSIRGYRRFRICFSSSPSHRLFAACLADTFEALAHIKVSTKWTRMAVVLDPVLPETF